MRQQALLHVPTIVTLALLTLGFPHHAHAQEPAAGDASEAEARASFEAGRIAFGAERYEEALQGFRRAYELSGRPELLYNVGAAAERLARDAEALEAYRAFVAGRPDHPQRMEAERRITVLTARLRAGAAAAIPADVPPVASPPPTSDSSSSVTEGGWLWSWVALGATAVAGASIGLSWALANDAYGSLERSCGASGCSESQIASSETEARIAATNAMIVVTAVLGAATVLLFVIEAPRETETPAVAVGVGLGALQLRGTF